MKVGDLIIDEVVAAEAASDDASDDASIPLPATIRITRVMAVLTCGCG
jgi:hypothetical protein